MMIKQLIIYSLTQSRFPKFSHEHEEQRKQNFNLGNAFGLRSFGKPRRSLRPEEWEALKIFAQEGGEKLSVVRATLDLRPNQAGNLPQDLGKVRGLIKKVQRNL